MEIKTAAVNYSEKEVQVVRLWHWKKAMGYKEFAGQPSNSFRKDDLNRRARFHMRCVAAMDPLCPPGTSAASDEQKELARLEGRSQRYAKHISKIAKAAE